MRSAWIRFLRALVLEALEDDVTGMSAEMAYRFLFALFPLLLLAIAVVGMIGSVLGRDDLVRRLVVEAVSFLPSGIASSTNEIVAALIGQARTYAVIGVVTAVWGAASGIGALIKGLNRAYDVERPRSAWRRQIIAIVASLLIPPAGLVLLIGSVAGQSVLTWLGAALGIGGVLAPAIVVLQAVAEAALFLAGMVIVYRALPAIDQRMRDVVPGAVVATVGWIVTTQAFGVYVANLSGYRAMYGAFAAALSFLLWLYLVSAVVLIGAEINALLLRSERDRWSAPPPSAAGDAPSSPEPQ